MFFNQHYIFYIYHFASLIVLPVILRLIRRFSPIRQGNLCEQETVLSVLFRIYTLCGMHKCASLHCQINCIFNSIYRNILKISALSEIILTYSFGFFNILQGIFYSHFFIPFILTIIIPEHTSTSAIRLFMLKKLSPRRRNENITPKSGVANL